MSDLIDKLSLLSSELFDHLRKPEYRSKHVQEQMLAKYFDDLDHYKMQHAKLPEFKTNLDWINVTRPLTLTELSGKLVLFDFFTYCCINCMHILPELDLLEKEFPVTDGFIVIGVHSAKFTNEKDLENVKAAVERYNIHHPVINDVKGSLWDELRVHCWPTMVLLGPDSYPILILLGEGHYDKLRMFIKFALDRYEARLSPRSFSDILSPLNFVSRSSSLLSYPGKVGVNVTGTVLAIADTGNHRIILGCSTTGKIFEMVGSGVAGFADGPFRQAQFNSPQGVCFGLDEVYVADTENHAVRKICLKTKMVTTLVGNGQQGHDYSGGNKCGRDQEISSPWDVLYTPEILYIAVAGTHQIWGYAFDNVKLWKVELRKGRCYALVGSGREENKNNRYPLRAGLAQPSGLTMSDKHVLYFADSESSTVRSVMIAESGQVEGVVGGELNPANLFAFGDIDGVGLNAKLQHPLDVAYCTSNNMLYVADSYNHKLKAISPQQRQISTVKIPPDFQLKEPGGLCCYKDLLYIADTNNHCIKKFNVTTEGLEIIDFKEEVVEAKSQSPPSTSKMNRGDTVSPFHLSVNPAGKLELGIELKLSEGVNVTPNAPSKWSLYEDYKLIVMDEPFTTFPLWSIPIYPTTSCIVAKCRLFLCRSGVCTVKELQFRFLLELQEKHSAETKFKLTHIVPFDDA